MAHREEVDVLELSVVTRELDQDREALGDPEVAGETEREPDRALALGLRQLAGVEAVPAEPEVDARGVVALVEQVLAADGRVGEIGAQPPSRRMITVSSSP